MKSKLILTSFLALGTAIAQEPIAPQEPPQKISQQFGYVGAGVGPLPLPLPVFMAGYRTQTGHHGADLSLQASTIVVITELKTNFLYHYYFNPSLTSEFYVGGGIGTSILFGSKRSGVFFSPEFVFGKQYRNESNDLRFFQLQISFPTIAYSDERISLFPLVTLSYGIGF